MRYYKDEGTDGHDDGSDGDTAYLVVTTAYMTYKHDNYKST